MDTLAITTSCISLQANEAIYGSGHWTILAGSGGSIQDTSLASSLFCGIPGQTYLLEWSVRNNCGISRDTVRVGFAVIPFACGDTFTDSRDGQHYPSVDIGGQCWMAANLNAGNLVSGNTAQSDNGVVERYCYANQVSNCLQYGGLYQWDEAMGYATGSMVQGICPDGWHLPSHAEWIALETYLGGPNQAGAALKESGTTHWAVPNSGADNSSGFTALPGGYRNTNGGFYLMPYQAYFWTASEDNTSGAWGVNLSYDLSKMVRGSHLKAFGYSVRCVKD